MAVEPTPNLAYAPALAPESASLRLCAAACLLAFALLLPAAYFRPVQASDEGRYAEVARETLADGHWLVPYLNGVPHLTKSPLYTDLVALSLGALGANRVSLRIVSIAAFAAMLVFAMRWAGRLGGRRAARLCALTALTMIFSVGAAEFGDLNTLLTCFLTLGLLQVCEALAPGGTLRQWMAGWLFLGLAFLVKGPPALLVPAATLLLHRWFSGRAFRRPWAWWWLGGAVFCGVGFSWYGWLLATHGRALWTFWVGDVLERTSAGDAPKSAIYYLYYLPVFVAGSSGWGAYMLRRAYAAARARQQARAEREGGRRIGFVRALGRAVRGLPAAEQFLLAWTVGTLLTFAACRSSMVTYILPAYPAAAVLLALYLARSGRSARRMVATAAAITVLGLWGGSLYQAGLVRQGASPTSSPSETVEFNALARAMLDYPDTRWDLVECSFQCPLFAFLSGRKATLCDVQSEETALWPHSSDLDVTREELVRRASDGRPLMILVKRKKRDTFFPAPVAGLRVLAEGPTTLLLTTIP